MQQYFSQRSSKTIDTSFLSRVRAGQEQPVYTFLKDYVLPRWVNLNSEEGAEFWNNMVTSLQGQQDIDLGSIQKVVVDLLEKDLNTRGIITSKPSDNETLEGQLLRLSNDITRLSKKEELSTTTKERITVLNGANRDEKIGILIDVLRDFIDCSKRSSQKTEEVEIQQASNREDQIVREEIKLESSRVSALEDSSKVTPLNQGSLFSRISNLSRIFSGKRSSEQSPKSETRNEKLAKSNLAKLAEVESSSENKQAESFFKILYQNIGGEEEAELISNLFEDDLISSISQCSEFKEDVWDKMSAKIEQVKPRNFLEVKDALTSVLEDYAKEMGIKLGQTQTFIVDNQARLKGLAEIIQEEVEQKSKKIDLKTYDNINRACFNIRVRFSENQSIASLFLILNELKTIKNPSSS